MSQLSTHSFGKTPKTGQESARNAAIDFTKGVLVLLMVLYHWLNYFAPTYEFGYRYIRFITPSFIFLTGFLITNLLVTRAGRNSKSLFVRLFSRGAKILVLFTILNLGVAWLKEGDFLSRSIWKGYTIFIKWFPEIYLTGEGASFIVLLPISYTLILAALFQKLHEYHRLIHPAPYVVAFIVVTGLVLSGVRLATLELMAFGLLGLMIGHGFTQPHNHLRLYWPWLLVAYGLHLVGLTVWGVPFTFQLVSVCLNLSLLYYLGLIVRPTSAAARLMLLLGHYTLVGYVGQIAILQILARTFQLFDLGFLEAPLALVTAILLTTTMIVVIDLLRSKSHFANSIYRLVFA